MDVSLGNQRNQRIVVNEGDSPSQLAEDFAREHGKFMNSKCLVYLGSERFIDFASLTNN